MKKIIRILFVCLFFIALIFIGKNVLKDGKEREYIKSDKYYEENIENDLRVKRYSSKDTL